MEKFMYLFRGGDTALAGQSPEVIQNHMQKWMTWMKKLGEKGTLVAGEPLQSSGKQVNGKNKVIIDGPFIEAKEAVGGYLIVHAKDIHDAVEISKECPSLELGGKVEVRPIQKLEM